MRSDFPVIAFEIPITEAKLLIERDDKTVHYTQYIYKYTHPSIHSTVYKLTIGKKYQNFLNSDITLLLQPEQL